MNTTQKKPYELKQASPHYQENVCINRPAHSQEEDNELFQAGVCVPLLPLWADLSPSLRWGTPTLTAAEPGCQGPECRQRASPTPTTITGGFHPPPLPVAPADPFTPSPGCSVPSGTALRVHPSPAQPRPRQLRIRWLRHALAAWLDPGPAWRSQTVSEPGCHHQTRSCPADWLPHRTSACLATTDRSGDADPRLALGTAARPVRLASRGAVGPTTGFLRYCSDHVLFMPFLNWAVILTG